MAEGEGEGAGAGETGRERKLPQKIISKISPSETNHLSGMSGGEDAESEPLV